MPYYAKPDLEKLKNDAWYSLTALAEIFDCTSGTLRADIKNEKLKARKKGRTWLVLGGDAMSWWNED